MAKKVIPFGDRLLVKRMKVGDKLGSGILVAPESTKDRPTDLAEVVYVPDHSAADQYLLDNANDIISAQTREAAKGNSSSLTALLTYNQYLKIKQIKVGDKVMISKYVGVDFHDSESPDSLTMVQGDDIIGLVRDE